MEQKKCPICGNPAEAGFICGADSIALRWIVGEPGILNNLKKEIGMGKIIGDSPFLKGSHVKGVRCKACNRIVIDL